MKNKILIFLFTVGSLSAFGQAGSLSQSVYRSRVLDSTSVTTPAGWGLLYFNTQRSPAAWVFSNDNGVTWRLLGSGSGGGGGSLSDGDYGDVTVSSSGTSIQIDAGAVSGTEIASSVALAGNPTTTTQSAGNNSTRVATTAYVDAAVTAGSIPDGDKGDITVSSSGAAWEIDAGAVTGTEISSSVALAGSPTTTTQTNGDNSTKIATTAYADSKVAAVITNGVTSSAPDQNQVFDALALKAPLASPTFTGTPAAPTASTATNTTQLSTTAFVQQEIVVLGEAVSASTASGTITMNMDSRIGKSFYGSASFATPKTIALSNVVSGKGVFIAQFEVTSVDAILTVPSDWKMNDINFDGTTWTPPETGEFIFGGKLINGVWYVNVAGPFY